MSAPTAGPGTINEQWFTLHVEVNPTGHASATVPVRWHITPELVAELDMRGFTNPYVILTVRHLSPYDYGKDARGVNRDVTKITALPLSQELQYVSFSRPGSNEITAVIIDMTKQAAETVQLWIEHDLDITHPDGTPDVSAFFDDTRYIETKAIVAVEVPAEMFAPEPPAWQKKLVGFVFRGKGDDQCHFRKRLIASTAAMVLVQLYGLVARLITLIWALYFGFRKMHWKLLLALNPHEFMDSHWQNDGTWWTRDKNGRERSDWWLLISPIIPAAAVYGIFNIRHHRGTSKETYPLVDWGFWETVLRIDLIILTLVASIIIAAGIHALLGTIAEKGKRQHRPNRQRAREEAARAALLAEFNRMAGNDDTRPSLTALPAGKQTIYLRFLDVKARVYKPFAN